MGFYLYCIAAAATRVEAPAGLDGEPVIAFGAPPFVLWGSELPARPEATVARISAHNAVIEAVAAAGPAIPVRFGQWSESPERIARKVLERRDAHEATLERVAGAVEFGVRILDPAAAPRSDAETPATAPQSGRAYLETRAREIAARAAMGGAAERLAAEMETALAGIVRATKVEPLPSAHGVLSATHLVAGHDSSGYRRRVEAFREAHPELRFLITGPWPPYSFAE